MLANVGNAVYSVYVAQLPAGPIWALHTFYVVTLGPDAALASAVRQGASGPRSDRSHQESTMTEHIETVIIGAGQAGLATAYHLQRCGRACLILDGNARVGDNWRTHWDSLRLYSPTGSDGLPGMTFPGPKWSYPTKDQVADYLEAYAERFALPVRNRARVERLEFVHGRYAVRLGPETITADNVVVATGTFGRTPNVPEFALDLDPSIRQLHSSEYRRPDQLRPGPVLVVGASHSGTDIAFEVAPTHPTILSGRDLGALPVRLDHWSARLFWPVFLFMGTHVLTGGHPWAARRWTRSGSTAGRPSGTSPPT